MKTSSLTSFLFASSLALGVASAAYAQPGPGPMQGPGMAGHMGMEGHGGMRGGMHGGGAMRGMRALGLTEAQQDQVFKIHHDQEPAFRDQMKKVRAARQEMRKLALADRYDEAAVRRAADAQAKAMSDMAVMHAQAMNRVRQILTPEQRAKMDQFAEHRFGPGPR